MNFKQIFLDSVSESLAEYNKNLSRNSTSNDQTIPHFDIERAKSILFSDKKLHDKFISAVCKYYAFTDLELAEVFGQDANSLVARGLLVKHEKSNLFVVPKELFSTLLPNDHPLLFYSSLTKTQLKEVRKFLLRETEDIRINVSPQQPLDFNSNQATLTLLVRKLAKDSFPWHDTEFANFADTEKALKHLLPVLGQDLENYSTVSSLFNTLGLKLKSNWGFYMSDISKHVVDELRKHFTKYFEANILWQVGERYENQIRFDPYYKKAFDKYQQDSLTIELSTLLTNLKPATVNNKNLVLHSDVAAVYRKALIIFGLHESGRISTTRDGYIRQSDAKKIADKFSKKGDPLELRTVNILSDCIELRVIFRKHEHKSDILSFFTQEYTIDALKKMTEFDSQFITTLFHNLPYDSWVKVDDILSIAEKIAKKSNLHPNWSSNMKNNVITALINAAVFFGVGDLEWANKGVKGSDLSRCELISFRKISPHQELTTKEKRVEQKLETKFMLLPNGELHLPPNADPASVIEIAKLFSLKNLNTFIVDKEMLAERVAKKDSAETLKQKISAFLKTPIPHNIENQIDTHFNGVTKMFCHENRNLLYLYNKEQLTILNEICKDKIIKVIDDRLVLIEPFAKMNAIKAKLQKASVLLDE